MSGDDFLTGLMNSKLPYGKWLEQAYQSVMINALEYVSKNGLPADHHFFLTFRTDNPKVQIPPALKKKYPEEMTIVLQHQFHNLTVDKRRKLFSVELSFGGVRSQLTIPFSSITGFADPAVHMMFRFEPKKEKAPPPPKKSSKAKEAALSDPQVISLDAFRKKRPNHD